MCIGTLNPNLTTIGSFHYFLTMTLIKPITLNNPITKHNIPCDGSLKPHPFP